jgi:hypothetical protein
MSTGFPKTGIMREQADRILTRSTKITRYFAPALLCDAFDLIPKESEAHKVNIGILMLV